MLKPLTSEVHAAGDATFCIVASQYNSHYVDAMLRAAQAELRRAKVKHIQIIRVPGAYEIPLVAACVARSATTAHSRANRKVPSAIICLGVILRGETVHAAHIG